MPRCDRRVGPAAARDRRRRRPEQVDEADDGVERRAQLVRDVSEKLALRVIGARTRSTDARAPRIVPPPASPDDVREARRRRAARPLRDSAQRGAYGRGRRRARARRRATSEAYLEPRCASRQRCPIASAYDEDRRTIPYPFRRRGRRPERSSRRARHDRSEALRLRRARGRGQPPRLSRLSRQPLRRRKLGLLAGVDRPPGGNAACARLAVPRNQPPDHEEVTPLVSSS